jgi:hypothetical protein
VVAVVDDTDVQFEVVALEAVVLEALAGALYEFGAVEVPDYE